MKCENEGCENEATVHETVRRKGKVVVRHLCQHCAEESGISMPATPSPAELLLKLELQHKKHMEEESARPGHPAKPGERCPTCGMTMARFRQRGLLGCADCYTTFETELTPLIERAHEGHTQHVGKVPTRRHGVEAHFNRISALRRQLSEAVGAEQYERAAKLRDELRTLESEPPVRGDGAEPAKGAP